MKKTHRSHITFLLYPEKQLPSGVCAQPTVSLRQELFRDYPAQHSLQSSNQRISAQAAWLQVNSQCMYMRYADGDISCIDFISHKL
jgi:hypothetical protein